MSTTKLCDYCREPAAVSSLQQRVLRVSWEMYRLGSGDFRVVGQ